MIWSYCLTRAKPHLEQNSQICNLSNNCNFWLLVGRFLKTAEVLIYIQCKHSSYKLFYKSFIFDYLLFHAHVKGFSLGQQLFWARSVTFSRQMYASRCISISFHHPDGSCCERSSSPGDKRPSFNPSLPPSATLLVIQECCEIRRVHYSDNSSRARLFGFSTLFIPASRPLHPLWPRRSISAPCVFMYPCFRAQTKQNVSFTSIWISYKYKNKIIQIKWFFSLPDITKSKVLLPSNDIQISHTFHLQLKICFKGNSVKMKHCLQTAVPANWDRLSAVSLMHILIANLKSKLLQPALTCSPLCNPPMSCPVLLMPDCCYGRSHCCFICL